MIKVKRINNTEVVLNSDQIEYMEETPDLVITLVSGRKLVVSQTLEEVIRMILSYKRAILNPSTNG
ncbi:MAG: flagellar FlbD family protein [Firmicutes bacterium]|nr:flagellar FlbD family protein [Bacillota bacterium]